MKKCFGYKFYFYCITILCLIFAISQFYLNSHVLFTPDELWVAHSIYNKYRISFPYRDFIPYKTVIGYYLFLIPLMLTQDTVNGLIYLKFFLTLINTCFLFISAIWLTRFYNYRAIIISLALLISTSFFIYFSADIRVDLLAYWCSLFCVLFLLEKRYLIAGLTLGLAFCISQKVIWYAVAANVALALTWLIFQRQKKAIYPIILFNFSFITIISMYLVIWISISDIKTVLDSVFFQALTIYKIEIYHNEIPLMLSLIIKQNLFYLVFWFVSVLSLLASSSYTNLQRRVFILTFAWTSLFFLIAYKQPFFYYTIAVLPALFLLYTDFFNWLDELRKDPITIIVNGRFLIYIFLITTLCLISIQIEFVFLPTLSQSIVMLFLITLPAIIYFYLRQKLKRLTLIFIYFIIFVSGILTPVIANSGIFFNKGYQYQQLVMRVVSQLLEKNDTYVAGVDLLYNRMQPISGNFFLEQNILFLNQPDAQFKALLLPALDLNPSISFETILKRIEQQPVKVFIHCPFMDRLPRLMDYLLKEYSYWWGNIYIYGPKFVKERTSINIKFSGKYILSSQLPVILNGKTINPQTTINLFKGNYRVLAKENFRLILQPDGIDPLPKKYYSEIPERLFDECVKMYINHKWVCTYFSIQAANKQ